MTMESQVQKWHALYEAAITINKMQPWGWIQPGQVVGFEDPATGGHYYASLQAGPEGSVIQLLAGEEGLFQWMDTVQRIMEGYGGMENVMLASFLAPFTEESFNCLFLGRDKLVETEVNLLRELGYDFQGTKQWVAFRVKQAGRVEEILHTQEDVALMTKALGLLADVIGQEKAEPFVPDILIDAYIQSIPFWRAGEDGQWRMEQLEWTALAGSLPYYTYPNQLETMKIRKLRGSRYLYELLRVFVPAPIEHESGYYYPMVVLLMDLDNGLVVWNHTEIMSGNYAKRIVDSMAAFFLEMGAKPVKLLCADDFLRRMMVDFCEKARIMFEMMDETAAGDDFLDDFLAFLQGGFGQGGQNPWEQMNQFMAQESGDDGYQAPAPPKQADSDKVIDLSSRRRPDKP